eukprot:3304713-Amphidinium_carterae.2
MHKLMSLLTKHMALWNQMLPGLDGLTLRTRYEPRVKLLAEPAVEAPEVPIKGQVVPEAPFQIGPHQRVVRHETFIQCLDCGRQTGKVKGEYNFAYLNSQDCRKFKKKKGTKACRFPRQPGARAYRFPWLRFVR